MREEPRATGELVFAAFEVLLCSSNATIQSLPNIPIRPRRRQWITRGSLRTETFTSSVLLKSVTAGRLLKSRILSANGLRKRSILNSRADGGGERDRTDDLLLAKQALSQLSYTPDEKLVGLDGFEPSTPRLSSVCSDQLSYRPAIKMGPERL